MPTSGRGELFAWVEELFVRRDPIRRRKPAMRNKADGARPPGEKVAKKFACTNYFWACQLLRSP
jgi:hypothetical protein